MQVTTPRNTSMSPFSFLCMHSQAAVAAKGKTYLQVAEDEIHLLADVKVTWTPNTNISLTKSQHGNNSVKLTDSLPNLARQKDLEFGTRA